jgi:hypothetical protein
MGLRPDLGEQIAANAGTRNRLVPRHSQKSIGSASRSLGDEPGRLRLVVAPKKPNANGGCSTGGLRIGSSCS